MTTDPTAMSELAAHAIYESSNDRECRWLHLEWMLEYFVMADLDAHFAPALKVHDLLQGYTEAQPFVYNDLDNRAFQVPWRDGWRAFAIQTQAKNYVYLMKQAGAPLGRMMRVYEYWDVMPVDKQDRWSDDPNDYADLDNQYGPQRPTLEWLVDHGGLKYEDCRDPAFVVKSKDWKGTTDGTPTRLMRIKWALWNISSLQTVLSKER